MSAPAVESAPAWAPDLITALLGPAPTTAPGPDPVRITLAVEGAPLQDRVLPAAQAREAAQALARLAVDHVPTRRLVYVFSTRVPHPDEDEPTCPAELIHAGIGRAGNHAATRRELT